MAIANCWCRSVKNRLATLLAAVLLAAGAAASSAAADAVRALREFSVQVKSARAEFTQTVTSPDGARRKTSSGSFEFVRPDRFRFVYTKPFAQQIVADGRKVWLYDVDLNQVTVRDAAKALGATPAALLAGFGLERDFELSTLPARDGLDWAQALPRQKEGASISALRVGFRAGMLAALEITDAFGQLCLLRFSEVTINPKLTDESFRFVAPAGVDVIAQ